MDVRTLAIDCELERIGDASSATLEGVTTATHWSVRRSLSWLGAGRTLTGGYEHISTAGGGQNNPQQSPANIYVLPSSRRGEHNQAVLPCSLVRWNWLSSPYNSSTEDQLLSTQDGAAQETSDHSDSTHTTSFAYTEPPYAYRQLQPHMHAHHLYMHVINSLKLCHVSCNM